jgi:tetratricopeptide (TPR) repeat protein
MLLEQGLADESILQANEALKVNTFSFQDEIKKSASAILGSAYFRKNDFKRASSYLEEFMRYTNPEDRYNVYLFTLAVSYEFAGDRSKAIEKYRGVRKNFIEERDGELDKFFYRLAQEKLKTPITHYDSLLIVGLNLRESNKLNEAINLYEKLSNSEDFSKHATDDYKIRMYFAKGITYAYMKNFDKAMECFYKCIVMNPEHEIWLLPHSYFELGKIYARKRDSEKAQQMFEKIYDYDDFDFESFLEMRLANYLSN